MNKTPIKLRPHHFLCMLTYIGKGYSRAFKDNFGAVITALNTGKTAVEVVRGPDDVCAPRLCDPDDDCHCREGVIADDDDTALADIQKLFETLQSPLAFDYGAKLLLTPEIIRHLRTAYDNKTIRRACEGCQWFSLCTQVSEHNYKDAYLDGE